jgi:hypothetical protein
MRRAVDFLRFRKHNLSCQPLSYIFCLLAFFRSSLSWIQHIGVIIVIVDGPVDDMGD